MPEIVTPNEFVSEFCKIIGQANQKFHKGALLLPNEEILAQVVVEAWKASLATDEGRPIHFRILYRLDDGEDNYFRLTEPIRCEVSELVRLAPAIGPDMRRLVVVSSSGATNIVGIEDEILHSPPGLAKSMNLSLTTYDMSFIELSVLGPTRLRLMHGPIGLEYDKGEIHEFLPAWHIPEFLNLIKNLCEKEVSPGNSWHPSHRKPLEMHG